MIIAINGKKGHGKDLFTKALQYYLFIKVAKNDSWTFQQFLDVFDTSVHSSNVNYGEASGWHKKMFAEKVKQIVCLLIGCSMEQLEYQAFKEKPLGEEWRVWYLSHTKVKSDLNPLGKFSPIFFLKEEAEDFLRNFLLGSNVPAEGCSVESYLLTPRLMLQLIGTECGRKIIHPNVWVNATLNDYVANTEEHRASCHQTGPNEWTVPNTPEIPEQYHGMISATRDVSWLEFKGYPNWIITDLRFPNEFKAIKDKGGITVLIQRIGNWVGKIVTPTRDYNRIGHEDVFHKGIITKVYDSGIPDQPTYEVTVLDEARKGAVHNVMAFEIAEFQDNHESETALNDYQDTFDAKIINDGEIDSLLNSAQYLLKSLNLIK